MTDANGLADGTLAIVKGTIVEFKGSKGDNVIISDGTTTFVVYSPANLASLGLGDKITVEGTIGSYNGTKQLAKGATAVIDEDHSAVGCKYPETGLTAICTVCAAVKTHDCADGDDEGNKCDACGEDLTSYTYTKITDSVSVGDKVIFVSESKTAEMSSIGIQKYGEQTVYTTAPAGLVVLEIVAGTQDGTVGFKTADGKFLTWLEGNYLQLATSQSANTDWKVSFDANGNAGIFNQSANGLSETRQIRFNPSNPRFSVYKSGQNDIQLYKQA